MPSNYLILCHLLLLLPSIFPSIRVFPNQSALHIRWPTYWSFSFSINASNEHSGLISFRMGWFDLLAVQGTQESSPTPQFKSIHSLVLSFLYSPTLTSIHDRWKNHSFDQMDLCWQSNVSAFSFFKFLLYFTLQYYIQRDDVGWEVGEGFMFGSSCTPMADSCLCFLICYLGWS